MRSAQSRSVSQAVARPGTTTPVLKTHEGVKTANFLNYPAMQDQTIMLTSDNEEGTFHLTCSQPDFGYAAFAAYRVQCSLTEDFQKYEEISRDFYNCAQINPLNKDVAAALEYLSNVKTEEDLPLPYQKLYMRLRAFIPRARRTHNTSPTWSALPAFRPTISPFGWPIPRQNLSSWGHEQLGQ